MNIIALFDQLQIDRLEFLELSSEKISSIENKLNEARITNSAIDNSTATNFLEALYKYPKEFQYIVNDRNLFNFFAKTNLSSNQFNAQNIPLNEEKMLFFMDLFLKKDITLFYNEKMAQNQFEEITFFLENKTLFPQDLLMLWNNEALSKIDFALARIHGSINQTAAIDYVKNRSFYDFLSHFSSIEMDEKVRLLLFKIDKIYQKNKRLGFAHETLFAMSYYQPAEADFKNELMQGKSKVENKSSDSTTRGIRLSHVLGIVVALIAVSRLIFLIDKFYDSIHTDNELIISEEAVEEKPVLDRYYTSMKPKVDSLNRYLVDYDTRSSLNLKYLDYIKTGDNPFKFLFNNGSYAKIATGVTIHNQSEYDVVLFEKAILFDSIKMPQQAVFLRSNQSLELTTLGEPSNRVFSFYAGKKLATFHAENELPIVCENSVEEPRFKELASNAKSLLSKDYFLQSDLFIKSENGNIVLDSKNLIEFTTPKQ